MNNLRRIYWILAFVLLFFRIQGFSNTIAVLKRRINFSFSNCKKELKGITLAAFDKHVNGYELPTSLSLKRKSELKPLDPHGFF